MKPYDSRTLSPLFKKLRMASLSLSSKCLRASPFASQQWMLLSSPEDRVPHKGPIESRGEFCAYGHDLIKVIIALEVGLVSPGDADEVMRTMIECDGTGKKGIRLVPAVARWERGRCRAECMCWSQNRLNKYSSNDQYSNPCIWGLSQCTAYATGIMNACIAQYAPQPTTAAARSLASSLASCTPAQGGLFLYDTAPTNSEVASC